MDGICSLANALYGGGNDPMTLCFPKKLTYSSSFADGPKSALCCVTSFATVNILGATSVMLIALCNVLCLQLEFRP
jgi:hypothetical protein